VRTLSPAGSPVVQQRRARVATAAAFAAQGLMFTILLTHLPQFTDKYDVSDGTVTLIVLTVTVLAGVGSLLSEVLAGATSSRTALRCGLLVVAAAGTVIGLASNLPVFVAGFAVYGIGVGAVDAAGNMQAVAVQHRYGRSIITSFHAAWSGAAIVGALYVAGGERVGISLAGSILPVAAVVLLIILVGGPYLLPREADPNLEPVTAIEPGAPEAAGAEPSTGFRISVTRGPLLMLGLAMTCFWAVDSGVSNWSALYLHDLLHASGSTAALGFALYQSMALVSRLAGDPTVRRFGAVTAVRTGAILGTAGTALVVAAPGPVVAIAGFGLAGLGLPVIAPLCFSAAGAAVRAEQQGASAVDEAIAVDSVVARLNVFNYLGSLVGAVLVGAVATVSNLRAGFVVPILLAGAVFFLARAFAPAPARAAG
jgi:MFS family permease